GVIFDLEITLIGNNLNYLVTILAIQENLSKRQFSAQLLFYVPY
ncbi:unnamed protein product, partial [marine sediment metagenome]